MGHTTKISDYEMDRAATRGPEVEGYDIEVERTVTKSKVIEAEENPEPEASEAKTKDL